MKRAKMWMGWLVAGVWVFGAALSRADTETVDGVEWSYTVTNGTATVTGAKPSRGDLVIPPQLGGCLVTSIGNEAFYVCRGLTSVIIPNNVTNIGTSAFGICSGLQSVTIPDSVTYIGNSAFFACSSLSSVTIPNNVRNIGTRAFFGCNLTTMLIPESVTSIGSYPLGDCNGLERIEVTIGNTRYESDDGVLFTKGKTQLIQCPGAKNGVYEIPDAVTSIGEAAFYGCNGLTSVTIPAGVTSIGTEVFSGCNGLERIEVAIGNTKYESVEGVLFTKDKKKLIQCPGGKSGAYEVVEETTSLGSFAFYGCNRLSSVTIPSSVTIIGSYAFAHCGGLESMTIPDNVTSIEAEVFQSCSNLTSVTIGQSVTYIGRQAFEGCRGLTSVTIPDSVTSVSSWAFASCSGLTSMVIPGSVTNIGGNVFSYCSGLQTLLVPSSWEGTALESRLRQGLPTSCTVVFGTPKTETIGGVEWTYALEEGNATILGVNSAEGALSVPGTMGGCSVTRIAGGAFAGCTELVELTIPDCVTNVGKQAFAGSGLTTIYAPSSWSETTMLVDAGVPSGCSVVYGTPESEVVEGVTWRYTVRDGAATVTGAEPAEGTLAIPLELGEVPVTCIASNAFDGCGGLTNVVIAGSVTNVGEYAFNNCTGLKSVTVPGSVKSIGHEAFSGCRGLEAVHIHDLAAWCEISFGSFYDANPLYQAGHLYMDGEEVVDLVIPDGVTSIDYVTFVGGRYFKSVTIPDSMTSIGYRAFSVCSGLQAVYIHDLAAWCRISFATSESNPLDYAHHLFVDGEEVTDLVIPDSITSIGKYAFAGCGGLASATIPETVTGIGYGAFYCCTNLASVTISDGVKRIDGDAFSGCKSLNEAAIPASVESIGTGAFQYCLALEEIVVEPGNARYESEEGVLFTKGKGELVQWPGGKGGDYEISAGVTKIWDYSFYGCSGVTGVTIPGSVTNVGAYAFYDCAGLTNVVMDKGVESLGARAFQNCTGLTTLTIPGSVARVGVNAFIRSGLVTLHVPESWKGTTMLASAGVPSGCTVVYDGGGENEPVWSYSVEDGQATVTGVSLAEGELVFPDTLGGFPVTAIGEYAFWNCSGLTGLTIPEGVRTIDSYAFRGCHGLTSLAIPASVTYIGAFPFSYCNGLEEITVAEDNVEYASENGVLFSKNMDELIWCPDAKGGDYVIPEGVKYIRDSALRGSTNLTSVAIPASVESIGRYAFAYCSGLQDITVAEGNECFASEDGVLFSKDKKTLLCCPGGKIGTYAIPDGVKCIGYAAFCGCMRVTSLGIPDGVTSVQRDAFGGCSDSIFDDARIPGVRLVDGWTVDWKEVPYGELELVGIRGIADGTFADCTGLTLVAIGNGAAGIGAEAFAWCTGLTELEVPETVKTIGNQAFLNSGLAKLVLPVSWEGTDMLKGAGVPEGCEVVYAKAVGQKLVWAALKDQYTPDERVVLEAMAGGGGKVLFEVLSGPGVVEGNSLSFTGAGLVTVRARQPGGPRWRAVEETRRVLIVAESGGRRVYADLAANYAADGWVDGSNGGEGFGAWQIVVKEGSGNGWAGCGIWNPSANGFTGTWAGKSKAFSMVGKGNGWSITAARDFARPLGIGDSFSLEMGIRLDSHVNGALKGFALTVGGEDAVVVNHGNSPGKISVNGDDGYEAANVAGLHPMTWTFTAVDATNILFTATGRDDPGNVCTGFLPVATSAIDGFRLQSANQYFFDSTNEERDGRQNYYDNFRLSQKLPQQEQGIAWDEIGPKEVGARVELAATADSGREVEFSVLSGSARIDGNELTFTGSGEARVMAWVPGDEMWTWASMVQTVEASWAPEVATETGVPYVWMEEHAEDILVETGGDWEEAANTAAKNGRKVWECFVAGLDPMVEEDDFRAEIKWEDGKPVVEASKEMPEGRVVKIEGRKGLEGGAADWTELNEGEDWQAQGWRFFRVRVALE